MSSGRKRTPQSGGKGKGKKKKVQVPQQDAFCRGPLAQSSDMSTTGKNSLVELRDSPELMTEDCDRSSEETCPSVIEGDVEETPQEFVKDTQSINSSRTGSVASSDHVIPQPCSAQKLYEPDFYELTPSDVGLQGILSIAPLWHELVVSLGVPFMTVQANISTPLGGMVCLSQWRNGQSGEGFPHTWRFLLKIVKESGTFGPLVAKTIEEKASSERSWSVCPTPLPGPTKHEYTSELCMKYKGHLGAHYKQMKTVEDTWLIQNNKQLTYIQLHLLEAEKYCDIKDSCPIPLGSHDTYSSLTRESNRYVPISTRDILSYNPGEQERKIVLLEGAPGSGKSTTARYLCKEYAAGRMFQEYELLIMVYLRLLPTTGCTSFSDLLILRPGYFHPPDIQKLFEEFSEGRGILLLLEGWDERPQNCSFLDSIIKGDELPASSILITSRHASAESLYQKVNRRIEIAPFSIEQKEEFVNNYFHNDKKKSSLLIDILSQRPILSDLCMYPMVLSIICFVYQTDGSLPSTVTEMYLNFLVLASNRYLKERVNVRDSVSSIKDILNSHHFEDFRNMAKLALEGVRNNQFVFSDDDLRRLGIKLPTSGYSLLLSYSQLDTMGVERGSHHYLHSSVQSCLAALELNLLDKAEQIKVLRECAPNVSKKPRPLLKQQYLDQLPEGPVKQRETDSIDCVLSDAEEVTKDQRLLLYQFFAGITKLSDQEISPQLMHILMSDSSMWHKSSIPIILFESHNLKVTNEAMSKESLAHLKLLRCNNYLLHCTGWCMVQTEREIEELTVNLSPYVQLYRFFDHYSRDLCSLHTLHLRGTIVGSSDLSSINNVLKRCPKLRKLYLRFSVVDSRGSAKEYSSNMDKLSSLVTDLPDLQQLCLGQFNAPLTDRLTEKVLTLITNSNVHVGVLFIRSSSPLLLQDALLSTTKMNSLHNLNLSHSSSQDEVLDFDDQKWRLIDDILPDTKLRKLYIASYSSPTLGDVFMQHIAKAASRRQKKDFMTIVFDTVAPESEEAGNMVNVCVYCRAFSTAFHYLVGDASHLEWIDSLGSCLISLRCKHTSDVHCLISCYGSELRGYVRSGDAKKHLPGLLKLAIEKGMKTLSLAMEKKDWFDTYIQPSFKSFTVNHSKEKVDITSFLTFDGNKCLDDNVATHYWNHDEKCLQKCKVLNYEVPSITESDFWRITIT